MSLHSIVEQQVGGVHMVLAAIEGSIWLMVLPVGTQLPPKLGGGFFVSWPAAAHV